MVGFDEAVIVAVITGLIELLKGVGFPKRFSPLVAVALGIAAGVFHISPDDTVKGVILGIVLGLSSVGLYSGPKNVVRGDQK